MSQRETLFRAVCNTDADPDMLTECLRVHEENSLRQSVQQLLDERDPVARTARAVEMFGRHGAAILPLITET